MRGGTRDQPVPPVPDIRDMFIRSLIAPACALALSATALFAQKQLTNQAIWYSPTFGSERVGGLASMKDGIHYTALEEEGGSPVLNQYAYKTGAKVATLVNGRELMATGATAPLPMGGYTFSGDEQRLMIESEQEGLYRYSYFARNHVYDRATKQLRPLADPAGSPQRLATFSPDGAKAAFVRDNDLFVVDLGTMKETAVTTDGEWNKVLNGATDWVYEEEFTLVQGYQWSPDGRKILYLRSDEGAVREFTFNTYEGELYPGNYSYKYPKAGEVNSRVTLHVYDLSTHTTAPLDLGTTDIDIYLPRFGFIDKDHAWFMRMDRLQRDKRILRANVSVPDHLGKPTEIYRETSDTYIEVTDDLHFLDNGGFILTSEKTGWNHIHWHDPSGTARMTLTSGEWDVLAVKGHDAAGKRVIFTASRNSPTEQEVWSVGFDGKPPVQLSPKGGYNDAEFSTGFKYFINTRSTANDPETITLHDGKGKLVKTLKDNARLRSELAGYGLQPKTFLTIPVNGKQLDAWMIKPAGFDAAKKYPVLMVQYSGPNSKEVLDQWEGRGMMWHQLLAKKGYIVVCVDPRGTGRHGKEFRHVTYGQLGKYEADDQIASAQWLGQQSYIDAGRIGIWGWSYGGFMSSLCITKGANVFKAAIAVAPVTNWRYYDSIYTERYMGLPKDNADGYDGNSPIHHVKELKGKYLLIHGTADDNVHFQNATEMVTALVKANKQFDQFMYPDKNHGIYGGTTRMQLYDLMTDWIGKNL